MPSAIHPRLGSARAFGTFLIECNGDNRQFKSNVLPYTACAMAEATDYAQVWIGVAGVVPREGCELLSPGEGAFVNFLTLASSDSEYRAKVSGALSFYRLELLEFQNVHPLMQSDSLSQEILTIATELEDSCNPKHVRYATFHTFPRMM